MSICVRLCVQYISCGYVSVQNLSETPRALSCGPPVADASCGSRALLRVCMKRKREGGVCRKVVSLRWSFLCFIYKHAVTHTKTLACVLTTVSIPWILLSAFPVLVRSLSCLVIMLCFVSSTHHQTLHQARAFASVVLAVGFDSSSCRLVPPPHSLKTNVCK